MASKRNSTDPSIRESIINKQSYAPIEDVWSTRAPTPSDSSHNSSEEPDISVPEEHATSEAQPPESIQTSATSEYPTFSLSSHSLGSMGEGFPTKTAHDPTSHSPDSIEEEGDFALLWILIVSVLLIGLWMLWRG